MKKAYLYLALSAATLFTACSKDDETTAPAATTTETTATINGAQQTPANNSTATGTFTGTYNSGTKQLAYTVTYQGITATAGHIHLGGPGVAGGVAVPFDKLASPITGTVTLTADQADKLLTNGLYVNIHSAAYPQGEIRGDIRKK
ncbi:CHRD domain-containing protein [Hymenobacter aquaticus]|uniref:CHRD domain-containing protein n=1 Tax=Hymenobacter aquaticus TaxID=1867101 RepID=A0A4Z0Q4Q9_9BACT|nr:CHRD domain-containing protein [Hymenobacter aquaticus]TGE24113.1 CHRD domain-containing protein [Hymenobacter aquaticus]